VILQQDAFDEVDRNAPMSRQKYMLDKVYEVYHTEFNFDNFEEVNPYFKNIINKLKQMNYSLYESEDFYKFEKEFYNVMDERKVN